MEWKEILEKRIRSKRQILFSKDDPGLQLLQSQVDRLPRVVIVSWALELAEETAALLERKYPEDPRPRQAVLLSRQWARGEVKMPAAKQAILACHAAAKTLSSPEDIAHYHAVAQACSTVHTTGHALGYPLYDLTALIRREGTEDCDALLEARMGHYLERLAYWETQCSRETGQWAAFLLK